MARQRTSGRAPQIGLFAANGVPRRNPKKGRDAAPPLPNEDNKAEGLQMLVSANAYYRENLWPEPYNPKPGAHEKDKVENYLKKQVCAGSMTLTDAQQRISTDWVSVWKQIGSP